MKRVSICKVILSIILWALVFASFGCGSWAQPGETAAEALDHADTSKEFLQRYADRWLNIYGDTFSNHGKMLRALEEATDRQLNNLASVLTGKDVLDLVKGKLQKIKLGATIAKKDKSLLKLLAGLLK